jgi:hypothetical protein
MAEERLGNRNLQTMDVYVMVTGQLWLPSSQPLRSPVIGDPDERLHFKFRDSQLIRQNNSQNSSVFL